MKEAIFLPGFQNGSDPEFEKESENTGENIDQTDDCDDNLYGYIQK